MPAKAGIQLLGELPTASWIPAYAGMIVGRSSGSTPLKPPGQQQRAHDQQQRQPLRHQLLLFQRRDPIGAVAAQADPARAAGAVAFADAANLRQPVFQPMGAAAT